MPPTLGVTQDTKYYTFGLHVVGSDQQKYSQSSKWVKIILKFFQGVSDKNGEKVTKGFLKN